MATLTADRAASTVPVSSFGGGIANFSWGVYELAANPSAADIIKFCKVPACKLVDGFLRGDDIDTGTEAFDMDIGTSADTDAYGNLGVITGDAVTEVKPETQIWMPLNGTLKDGPASLTAETTIQGLVNAGANATGTGTLYLGVYYVCGI